MEKYLNFVKVILDECGKVLSFEALPNSNIKSVVIEIKLYLLESDLDYECFTFVKDDIEVPISLNLRTPDIIQNYYDLYSAKRDNIKFL